jgi:hypothetical protein
MTRAISQWPVALLYTPMYSLAICYHLLTEHFGKVMVVSLKAFCARLAPNHSIYYMAYTVSYIHKDSILLARGTLSMHTWSVPCLHHFQRPEALHKDI